MLSLSKELEHSLVYSGKEYGIDLSFDAVLRWYEMMEETDLTSFEKAEIGFEIFFHSCALDINLLVSSTELIAKYIQQKPYGNLTSKSGQSVSEPTKYYSYTQDAEAIYASFLGQYGIDLVDSQGKLHWDKFKALLDGLNDDTYFKRIISVRVKETNGLEGKELTNLIEAQEYYMLDENRSAETQEAKLTDVFNALKTKAQS
ncbi:hypothetical protein KBX49_09100 [Liquorilactobacillus satsumensis]|uniref:bacteriophage Gp15 family protein n=1 Tax=Liquorilactobacillus satsumensis TaxID=259059 RepID=UPI0021C28009|nr:bacteriophage Gp15 family protein [Liquorilactobacillus satsumensis]MCP9357371.1 hypothetical protein [Liquorilactobacillus satsumensis]MCP9372069.1 hypothetical protein [Liquorilactobacillus satsumensis]